MVRSFELEYNWLVLRRNDRLVIASRCCVKTRRGVRSAADQIMRRLSAPPVATNFPEEEAATVRIEEVWWL